jgi:streptogramin lyase
MRTLALLLVSTATAALALTAGSARPASRTPAGCAKGSVKAVIGGHATCLRAGASCQSKFATQYRKYGFLCSKGRLRKLAKKPAPAPTHPPFPSIPSGPANTKLVMPAATPLPAGTTTITIPGVNAGSHQDGTLAATADAVWSSSGPFRVDAGSNTVTGPFASGGSQDIGVGEGSIWVSDYDTDQVRRLDQITGKQQAVIQLPAGSAPEGIVVTPGAVWVADHHGGTLTRIDPQTNRIVASVVVGYTGSSGPQEVAAGFGSVWVGVGNINSLVRVDPTTNKVTAFIPLPDNAEPCGGIAIGTTAVWVTGCEDVTTLTRVDPSTNTIVSNLDIGGEAIQPVADGNTVWFVSGGDPGSPPARADLIQLRADDTVAQRIALPTGFISGGAAVAFGSIWIADFTNPRMIRIPEPS